MASGDGPFKKNALFIAGGVGYTILGLLSCIFLTESTSADLADLAVTANFAESPKPCGVAVPSLGMLMTDLNFEAYPTVSGFRGSDALYFDTALRGLCRHDASGSTSKAVARLWNEAHEAVDDPFEFKRVTCSRTYVREAHWHALTGDNLQDPMSRLRRAYVRAQPAFAHYEAHKNTPGGVCAWTLNPFEDDTGVLCDTDDNHAAIQGELTAAAATTQVCGEATLPGYDEMVFRLVALATLAESDRATNGGRCFQNTLRANTADELCASLGLAGCGGWSAPAATVLYPWEQHTHPDAAAAWACDTEAKSEDLTDLYPTEPTRPRYELNERDRYDLSDTANAALEHCIRVHEYSSRTSEFLFGLPDIDRAPDPHPVGPVGDFGAWAVNVTYLPWFLDGREQTYSELKHSALRDGIAYEGFRFGFALFLRIPALYASAFWTGRGIILCVGSVVPAIRGLLTSVDVDEVKKPSGWALTTLLAVVVGLVAGVMARLLDPLAVPESSKTTCTEYASTGRVFDSSQLDAIRDYVASVFLFLVSAFAILWEIGLRRPKTFSVGTNASRDKYLQKRFREMRGLDGILLLLFIFLLLLEAIFCADLAIKSGHDLQLYIYDAEATTASAPLRHLESDVYFLQAVAVAHGGVIGAFTTMYAFATALGKGRMLPLILWLATILVVLAIGYARFGHVDTDRADDGTRAFTMTLTVIVDVALGAYAGITAYLRRAEARRKIKADEAARQKAEAERARRTAPAPKAANVQGTSFLDALKKGGARINRGVAVDSFGAPIRYERLPLLNMRVER